jgi:hypothetical protein
MKIIIDSDDCILVNELSARHFTGNTMRSAASDEERERFLGLRKRLKFLANEYRQKYLNDYNDLEVSVSTGNPIAIGGNSLNRIWSGIYKGSTNKQYSAQISFVLDPNNPCLNIGFYFGRASAHNLSREARLQAEKRLQFLGKSLVERLRADPMAFEAFESLFDFGFQAFAGDHLVSSEQWLQKVAIEPSNCQIVYPVYPNNYGIIDPAEIGLYVSMSIVLMGFIPSVKANSVSKIVKPLSPEERAKQAERRTLIGHKGELFVLDQEKKRLLSLGIDPTNHLTHVAEISTTYGYDIESVDESLGLLFLEVKTTTRLPSDFGSNSFHISENEYNCYLNNKTQYQVVRVYDIEGEKPTMQYVDLERVEMKPDGFLVKIPTT